MTQFKDHFSDIAASYAACRPRYPAALAEWLGSIAPQRELAWDAACGSGQLSTLLAEPFAKVIATDASREQITEAVQHPKVEYRVEPAESSSLASGSADLVTVAQAVHWLDLEAFYAEAGRVGRPGAVVALVAYHIAVIEPQIDKIIADFYGGELQGYWPPERKHIETGYRELAFPFARIPAPEMSLDTSWTVDQMLGYIRTWSAVRALRKAHGDTALERFAGLLRKAWGPSAREVRWPVIVVAGQIPPRRTG